VIYTLLVNAHSRFKIMQYLETLADIMRAWAIVLILHDHLNYARRRDSGVARCSCRKSYALYIPIVESSLTFHIVAETVECTFSRRRCILRTGRLLRRSHKRFMQASLPNKCIIGHVYKNPNC